MTGPDEIAEDSVPVLREVLGEKVWFELIDGDSIPALTVRERRLLTGAVNFHTAVVPDRVLTFHVYDGDSRTTPRTTDDRTFDGRSRIFRRRLYSFRARGGMSGTARKELEEAASLTASDHRHLYISSDEVLQLDPRRWTPDDFVRKTARVLRDRAPLIYDELRDLALKRHRSHERRPVERRSYAAEFADNGVHSGQRIVTPDVQVSNAPAAVLIGVHWFELGGAERWAFETVRAVRDQGLVPIVLSNVDSQHPFLARSELDGAVFLPLSEPTAESQPPGAEPLLARLLEWFDVRATLVHHNQWLYDRLPWLALARPRMPIVDSTHIVEHRGGGYAASSVRVDDAITAHHVISPTLAHWMRDVQLVPDHKIVMAPLTGLTVQPSRLEFKARGASEPFTVAFVGRMARQKAPEVFIEVARRVHQLDSSIRFIMHGDGEHAGWVDELISRRGLSHVIIRRSSAEPVEGTLAQSHLLVITSTNEGLTLTTMEAIAAGIPVVSTDVGAQRDVVPDAGLVAASPLRAAREAAEVISALSKDESARRDLWAAEQERERKLLTAEPALEWFERTAQSWSMSQQ